MKPLLVAVLAASVFVIPVSNKHSASPVTSNAIKHRVVPARAFLHPSKMRATEPRQPERSILHGELVFPSL